MDYLDLGNLPPNNIIYSEDYRELTVQAGVVDAGDDLWSSIAITVYKGHPICGALAVDPADGNTTLLMDYAQAYSISLAMGAKMLNGVRADYQALRLQAAQIVIDLTSRWN